jgi:hypothetical protein
MLMNIFIYIVVTLSSLFPFYFLCCHLFYFEKLNLNLVPFLLLGIFSVIHTDFIRSEELPFLNWHVEMGSSFFSCSPSNVMCVFILHSNLSGISKVLLIFNYR